MTPMSTNSSDPSGNDAQGHVDLTSPVADASGAVQRLDGALLAVRSVQEAVLAGRVPADDAARGLLARVQLELVSIANSMEPVR